MAANSAAEQQLRIAAEFAWNIRWKIAWDMNDDGMVTISDAWLWLKWIFFAPGDLLLLLLMNYPIIEACSPGPYLELFARGARPNWQTWGNQADSSYRPSWPTYKHHSAAVIAAEKMASSQSTS